MFNNDPLTEKISYETILWGGNEVTAGDSRRRQAKRGAIAVANAQFEVTLAENGLERYRRQLYPVDRGYYSKE